jgi:hypothetical protein
MSENKNSLNIEHIITTSYILDTSNNFNLDVFLNKPITTIANSIKVRFLFTNCRAISTDLIPLSYTIDLTDGSQLVNPRTERTQLVFNCGEANKDNWFDTGKYNLVNFNIKVPPEYSPLPNNESVNVIAQFR